MLDLNSFEFAIQKFGDREIDTRSSNWNTHLALNRQI